MCPQPTCGIFVSSRQQDGWRHICHRTTGDTYTTGRTETHIPHATFGFPGWTVFASPRKLKKTAGDTAGGVAILLRGLLLRSLVKEYLKNDGLPPECVALEFPAHVFGTIGQNVVILLAYVTRLGKVTNAYKQKDKMDLFSLISIYY